MKNKKEKKEKKAKKGRKKRGFFGRLIVFLLVLLALVGLVAMGMSVLGSYINPIHFVWLSFFGLTFWVIFLYNVVVALLLLLMRSRWVLVAVVSLLMAIPGFSKSFSFGKSESGGQLRVMSYNVMLFDDRYDSKKKSEEVAADIAEMVKANDPDVLCIQEFSFIKRKKSRDANIITFGEMTGMPYHYYHKKANFGGNVIYSRYPLVAVDDDTPFAKENEYGAIARVDAGEKGSFYVVNCHLTSFRLTQTELSVFSELGNSKEKVEKNGKSIVSKLKQAYEKRSAEVSEMLASIPHDGRPILLCGDFNDTPVSYTYHQIKHAGFTDGFIRTGRGIGHTYAGQLPLLRIDYVWTNDEIQPTSFKRLKYKGSDHYPVVMEFNVNHEL